MMIEGVGGSWHQIMFFGGIDCIGIIREGLK
jgi:hypothetical protein